MYWDRITETKNRQFGPHGRKFSTNSPVILTRVSRAFFDILEFSDVAEEHVQRILDCETLTMRLLASGVVTFLLNEGLSAEQSFSYGLKKSSFTGIAKVLLFAGDFQNFKNAAEKKAYYVTQHQHVTGITVADENLTIDTDNGKTNTFGLVPIALRKTSWDMLTVNTVVNKNKVTFSKEAPTILTAIDQAVFVLLGEVNKEKADRHADNMQSIYNCITVLFDVSTPELLVITVDQGMASECELVYDITSDHRIALLKMVRKASGNHFGPDASKINTLSANRYEAPAFIKLRQNYMVVETKDRKRFAVEIDERSRATARRNNFHKLEKRENLLLECGIDLPL